MLFDDSIFVPVFVTVFRLPHELHYLHLKKQNFSLVEFMRCAFVITALKKSFYAYSMSILSQITNCNFLFNFMLKKPCLKVQNLQYDFFLIETDPPLGLFRKIIRFGDTFPWSGLHLED